MFAKWRSGRLSLAAVAAVLAFAVVDGQSEVRAVTYDLGSGTGLGFFGEPPLVNPVEPPNALRCFDANDTCNVKKGSGEEFIGTYTGTGDIDSQALWKSGTTDPDFSITGTGSTGTWTQIWHVGDLIVHYAAVKSADGYHLIGYDLALITAALVDGDEITGTWTTGVTNAISHLVLYNSTPRDPGLDPIPLPAPAWLLLTGLAGMGFLARRRRSA